MKRILLLMSKYKRRIRKISIPFVMIIVSHTAQASCLKLAKVAGISQNNFKKIVDKLIKIETTSGKYTTTNTKSGAYGRYQIMPSTAKFYAKKLKIPKSQWRKPYNQDKIFKAVMRDNIASLKKHGHKISAFTLYATHQQGAVGFNKIIKNKPLSKILEKNLRQNLPSDLRKVKKSQLRVTWINYWREKLA